ncbi:hypothetical protein [Heliorestis convoluta]|uniref:Uncharacterized protein n=1 Tax=Heliorestis convoluta TaxID=356322 RepID=A0A5Q2N1V5_9FIRM|nr:hypothetical protein [Heliorestis convoluta]QGG49364.1 hypothetical protein FTV88_3298 [Heliorestis convoluta]
MALSVRIVEGERTKINKLKCYYYLYKKYIKKHKEQEKESKPTNHKK